MEWRGDEGRGVEGGELMLSGYVVKFTGMSALQLGGTLVDLVRVCFSDIIIAFNHCWNCFDGIWLCKDQW